jgi:CBS domain-containing protein
VNVAIAGVLYLALRLSGTLTPVNQLAITEGSFAERVMLVNIALVLFNMLPAFPMDGGRVLRAVLALRGDYIRATQLAATIGQGMALLFGLLGLFGNPFLIFIALFVWIGASQEAALTQMRSALAGLPVERVMITDFRTLTPSDRLKGAVDLLLSGTQHDFPVFDHGTFVGLLTRTDLLAALAQNSADSPVAAIMRREVPTAEASEMVDVSLARLQEANLHTMPVLRRGTLVGLLTLENIGEFVSVRMALKSGR